MGSTYHSIHFHLVFATKNREPLIRADWRPRLHEYLGGTIKGLGGVPEAIGGVEDHVHLLISLKTTAAPAEIVRELKKASSAWAAEHHCKGFAWQEGYGIFSVSWTHVEAVRNYIANQEEHHRKTGFSGEFKQMLDRNGVTYDPKYLT